MKFLYPSLLQAGNIIDSHNSFNLIVRKNDTITHNKNIKTFECSYVNTIMIKLYLTDIQKCIIQKWMNDCIDIYNITNNYIKEHYTNDNTIINFIKLRKLLEDDIKNICSVNKLNKHTGDYAVKHCVEMYKSALSNHKKDFTKFNIRNLDKTRRKKNIMIEPNNVSKRKNSIFVTILKEVVSSLPLNTITQNSILQYDSYKKTYIIISPKNITVNKTVNQYKRCGIDIGVRTFLTVYSNEECLEVGTNNNGIIDKAHKKLDSINSNYDKRYINKKTKENAYIKYYDKIRNKIMDVHNKTARMLLTNYSEIVIGNVSTKDMISNIKGDLRKITKRRLMKLSHYRFRMKLISMSKKFDSLIIETDEYMTSKTCCNCKNVKQDLGSSKVYECNKCKMVLDRDINASINIYKNENLRQ